MLRPFLAAFAVVSLAPALLAEGQHRREQDQVLDAHKNGVLSLRQIEQKVVPRMAGFDYLGPEFDPGTASYRLKFMHAGSVVWIDVDARTGAIIGRTGN